MPELLYFLYILDLYGAFKNLYYGNGYIKIEFLQYLENLKQH